MRRSRVVLAAVVLICWLYVPSLKAQTYLENVGVPPFTTSLPIENGFINAANGDLHLEIPLGSFSQRGGGTDKIMLMYDSAIWFPSGNVWVPTNVTNGGWRIVTSGDTGGVQSTQTNTGWCSRQDDYQWRTYYPFIWTAPDGTQHSFPVRTQKALYPTICPGGDNPNGSAYASDGSGFYLSITNYTTPTIYAPDGTIMSGTTFTDANGNQYTRSYSYPPYDQKWIDTLSRTVLEMTESTDGNTWYLAVPKAGGGTNTYTVKLGTVNVDTDFAQTGIYEYSGSFQAITEIDLPDGTAYYFSYDSGTSPGYY